MPKRNVRSHGARNFIVHPSLLISYPNTIKPLKSRRSEGRCPSRIYLRDKHLEGKEQSTKLPFRAKNLPRAASVLCEVLTRNAFYTRKQLERRRNRLTSKIRT